jgi:hypothetical protein
MSDCNFQRLTRTSHIESPWVRSLLNQMPSAAPLRIACAVKLPISADFTLQPVLRNDKLAYLGNHRYFFAFALPIAVLWLLFTAVPWSGSSSGFQWTIYALFQICVWSWYFVALTQMDRCLMKSLFRSFEYGLLIGQVVVIVVCRIVLAQDLLSCVDSFLFFYSMAFTLSLDAVIGATRLGKGFFLIAMFSMLVDDLSYAQSHPDKDEVINVTLFFYRTTVTSIRGSAILTLTLFVAKYLFHVLFRPGRMLILTSHIAYSVTRDDAGKDGLNINPVADLNADLIEEPASSSD